MNKIIALAVVPFAALGIGLAACSSSATPVAHHVPAVTIHAQPHRERPPVVVHHKAKPKAVVPALRPPEPVRQAPATHCGAAEALYHGVCVNNGTNSCVAMHDCAPLLPGQKPAPGQQPAPQPPVNPDPNDVPNAHQQATCCNADGVAYCCGG